MYAYYHDNNLYPMFFVGSKSSIFSLPGHSGGGQEAVRDEKLETTGDIGAGQPCSSYMCIDIHVHP